MTNNIVAPLSKHKKGTLILGIVALIGFGLWLCYDGYMNESFIAAHTEDGKPDSTLVFNQKAPPYLFAGAVLIFVYWLFVRKRRIVAGQDVLVIHDHWQIPYKAIQQIDKTYFEKKGYFVMTYKDAGGKTRNHRLSDQDYDNLGPILDHLVDQITR